jgi:hypothetical protein
MSLYSLQKLIRDVNRDPVRRDSYKGQPEHFCAGYDLTSDECSALIGLDIRKLYAFGVHGLLLRPFTILHGVEEANYLKQIRGEV